MLGTAVCMTAYSGNGLVAPSGRIYVEVMSQHPLYAPSSCSGYFVVFLSFGNGTGGLAKFLGGAGKSGSICLRCARLVLGQGPQLVMGFGKLPGVSRVEFSRPALTRPDHLHRCLRGRSWCVAGIAAVPRAVEAATSLGTALEPEHALGGCCPGPAGDSFPRLNSQYNFSGQENSPWRGRGYADLYSC